MFKRLLLAAGLAAATSTGVSAATSFDLTISGSTNVPVFTLTNTSDTALLERFSITIGLISRNFDYIQGVTNPSGGSSTIENGDGANGGTRFDFLELSFTSFDPGDSMSWNADIDDDNSNVVRNYQNTLFNNGAGPNSLLSAEFSDGASILFEMPDQTAGLSSYTFSVDAAPIPLPAGLPLLAAGLGALAVMRRRKG